MRKFAVVLVMLAIYGCADSDISKARSTVRSDLYDADSAQFRNEQVYRPDGRTVVCGEVNSKNRLGGYSGFQPFIVTAGEFANIGESTKMDCEFAEINSRLKK